jgi:HEAT repeat protein
MMSAWPTVFAASPWLVAPEQFRSSTLLFLALAVLGLIGGLLYVSGIVGAVLWAASAVVRVGLRTGFRLWERLLSWAPWPLFLAVQLTLLAAGIAAETLPGLTIACALPPLAMGLAACLAYMFIDVERYEVARGYKALHNPLKGQRLATELVRHGHRVGVPLLASSAVGMIGGFALLNVGLYRLLGDQWYTPPDGDPRFADFVAAALVQLLSVVDLLNVINTHRLAHLVFPRPVAPAASALLMIFKSFFTLVLLQQIFASVRKGRLLAETVADFWSPHESIHERARSAIPQFGASALRPLLLSLRETEALTHEQREQLPQVLAMIGPAAVPALVAHLTDPNEYVRAVCVVTLGRLRAADGLERMAALVTDPSDTVRLGLARALGELVQARTREGTQRERRERRLWGLSLSRRHAVPAVDPVALTLQTLRSALTDPAAAVRAAAAEALGRLDTGFAAEVAPDLHARLADADETVRERAAEALGAVGAGDPRSVEALTTMLSNPSPALRLSAARALGQLKEAAASAVPALVALFQDADEGIRAAAADAVGRIGTLPGGAATALATGLVNGDNLVRARTAESLGAVGEAAAEVAPLLVEAAADQNDMVRAKAVEALGKIGEAAAEVAVPRLVHALRDPDNWVRTLAAEALGQMGEAAEEAVPALIRSLTTGNPQVRANAAEALGKLGTVARPAVSALERAAAEEAPTVRAQAVLALGAIGTPTSTTVSAVRAALADTDPLTRAAAAVAFGAWGEADEDVCRALIGLLGDANDEVKVRVIRVLPRLAGGTPEVVEGLSHRLTADDSDWVRAEAARAMGQCGPASASAGPALLRAAQTGEAGLREEAMRALAVAQPPEAAAAFTSGMRDAEPGVRLVASAGWRKSAAIPDDAIPALIEALHDPEPRVRANAAHAVGRLDPIPAEAVPPLAECALAADTGLRLAAALGLQSAPGAAATAALRPLLDDPSPRLRLIAARRILADDPADGSAAGAVAGALTSPDSNVQHAASELLEQPTVAVAVLAALRARTGPPVDADADAALAGAIACAERAATTSAAAEPEPAVVPTPAG